MNCRAANRFYVQANGTIPCNCDIGENITLFAPPLDDLGAFDFIADGYNGPPFRRLRESFQRGEPYLECCESCFFFSPTEEFGHHGVDGRLEEIEDLQVESSFLCTIDCEACVPRDIRRDPERSPLGRGPYNLPVEVFGKLIDDLVRGGIRVGEFNFGGRGEPLLHPRFGELLTLARTYYPDALYTACTNGNMRFFPGIMDLDYLSVSIDGARPESYEQYRKGGRLELALKLIEDIARSRRPGIAESVIPELSEHLRRKGRPILRWKYLLFEHNDSEEETVEAQEKALALGVDQMVFYLSHTWNRSRKYTSTRQIEELALFQVFEGKRVFFSNVNPEVDNVEQWEDEGRRRG